MTLNTDPRSRRLRWSGIFAGLVLGTVATMAILALGAVVTSLTGITLTGTGIQALIWTAVAALVGAYVAGMVAVRASVPSAMDEKAAMLEDDAKLTGLVTGGLLVLLTSWMAATGIGNAAGAAGNALGSVASSMGGMASAVGGAAGTLGAAAAQNNQVQDMLGNITANDIEHLVAQNSDLSQPQVDATVDTVSSVINQAKFNLGDVDITNLAAVTKNRIEFIRDQLSGPEFVNRLERQGLSPQQAQEVQAQFTEQINTWETQANQAAQQAEAAARKAGTYAGLSWLISAVLVLLMAVMGAKQAAGGARTVRRVGGVANPPRS